MAIFNHPSCFEVELAGDSLIIHFTGRAPRLGQGHMRLLNEYLPGLLRESSCTEVVVDFANVATFDSIIVSELVRIHQGLNALDIHLRLRDLQPHVTEMLEITRLDTLLDLQPAEVCLSAANS